MVVMLSGKEIEVNPFAFKNIFSGIVVIPSFSTTDLIVRLPVIRFPYEIKEDGTLTLLTENANISMASTLIPCGIVSVPLTLLTSIIA